MKRTTLILAAAALLAASSCSRGPVRPDLDVVTIDTLLARNGAECRIEYRFTTIRNADKSPALQAIEQANIGYFFDLPTGGLTLQEAMAASIREIDTTCMPPRPEIVTGHRYEIAVESEITQCDTLLTCAITRSSYTGGAHGSYDTEYHNYSLTRGCELTTADLFTDAQLARLDTLILERICTKYGARDREELAERGFFPEEIGTTENFRLTADTITFRYNPYDIGCYALGAVEVPIARAEIDPR